MVLLNILFFSSIFCLTAGAVFPKVGEEIGIDDGIYFPENDVDFPEEQDLLTKATYLESIANFNGTLAWNHADQENWGLTFPNCNGNRRSPINIRNRYIKEGGKSCLVFKNYGTKHSFIEPGNLGTTVEFLGPFGTDENVQPTVSGGPLKGTYQLAAAHFHWGYDDTDGSEHAINSQKFPLELHLVHFNTDFSSINDALASGREDALSVIAILFKPSYNYIPDVFTLLDTVERARLGKLSYPFNFPLNIVERKTNYFTYLGSLTTPKCFESVRWIVFETPLDMRVDKFEVFRAFKVNGQPLVDNFRTTQQMNGRELIRHSC